VSRTYNRFLKYGFRGRQSPLRPPKIRHAAVNNLPFAFTTRPVQNRSHPPSYVSDPARENASADILMYVILSHQSPLFYFFAKRPQTRRADNNNRTETPLCRNLSFHPHRRHPERPRAYSTHTRTRNTVQCVYSEMITAIPIAALTKRVLLLLLLLLLFCYCHYVSYFLPYYFIKPKRGEKIK
jgi:hypothetical protein